MNVFLFLFFLLQFFRSIFTTIFFICYRAVEGNFNPSLTAWSGFGLADGILSAAARYSFAIRKRPAMLVFRVRLSHLCTNIETNPFMRVCFVLLDDVDDVDVTFIKSAKCKALKNFAVTFL
ncbi:hypothetical protein F5Y04DRAFT_34006 [Hypomontagnella monticulosa]|nr:hypothetical protein F5Y04DRAFT_34006 [Hypomontagnella monticulosa]